MTELIGLLGLFLIVAAWAVNIARRSPPPPIDLTLLYFLGSIALTVYAVLLKDIVFTVLNAVSSALSFINLIRAYLKK
ncbi:hypothetical protein [Pyrobaculum aerophilum]|uniref:CBU-0592-like domain-containing protein n=2 Tax=Pyrobaculum aerophilum TaxID=13773 RepID=Q8ZTT1_PYRAE|nr:MULTISPECIES: hypothetical protein [Pyrobaculum]AAL64678.1 hypothetical protein PAE3109 [Pyrobaculum aerophilum str. IM2]MCX8136534.1 hypothetical protein [Pyrobaculum aerophilum]RFA93333.1 hypothetical protein CGL51_13045 [Pyrobaculum aerophilum]RFA95775.1 hypothetical protein CGL52_12330 [Pyrobaculum aerophilum]HII46197.1 hypothetical protein [Pyrobaculum aerophilum]